MCCKIWNWHACLENFLRRQTIPIVDWLSKPISSRVNAVLKLMGGRHIDLLQSGDMPPFIDVGFKKAFAWFRASSPRSVPGRSRIVTIPFEPNPEKKATGSWPCLLTTYYAINTCFPERCSDSLIAGREAAPVSR